MSWLKKISGERAAQIVAPNRKPEGGEIAAPKARPPAADLDEFKGVLVSEKALKEHAVSFRRALADMGAIADAGENMQPHRASQFGRVVDNFYTKLGQQLSRMPAAERGDAAEATVKALRTLVEHLAHEDVAAPAISAMTDLLVYAGQSTPGAQPLKGRDIAAAAMAAANAVNTLLDQTEGRAGVASAFNVYPNIVWQIEHAAANPPGIARFQRWESVARTVADALPKSIVEPADITSFASFVAAELAKNPKDDKGALERAKQRIFAGAEPGLHGARDQARLVPLGVVAGAPSGIAHDLMSKAILRVLDGNPAGPASLGATIEELAVRFTEAAPHVDADSQPGWAAIAKILTAVADMPAAEGIARSLADNAKQLVENPAARAELRQAAAKDAAEIPAALIRANAVLLGVDANTDEIMESLKRITGLPPIIAYQAALAVLPYANNPDELPKLIRSIADFAKNSPNIGGPALHMFASRFSAVYGNLENHLGEEAAVPAARAVARANINNALDADTALAIAVTCAQIKGGAPNTPLAELMSDDGERRAGLITLSNTAAYRYNPRLFVGPLLQAVDAVQAPPAQKLELMRRALHLAGEIGKLDRAPQPLFRRVNQDWTAALQNPDALHFAMRAGNGVQANIHGLARKRKNEGGENAAVRFVRAHPELSPEIAFTAGLHLTSEQVTWLADQIGSQKSRTHVRSIRDALLACFDAGKLDLIEVMRTSKSPPAAIVAATTMIAAEYRAGRMDHLPWDAIADGLRAGGDPASAIEKQRTEQALAELGMQGMNLANIDAKAVSTIKTCLEDIQGVLSVMPVGAPAYGGRGEQLREPFMACLRAMVDGTWPTIKYDNAVGRRQLDGLTPRQKAIWQQTWITPRAEQAAGARAVGPELLEAMMILKGLAKGLEKEAKLGVAGLGPLAFDAASAQLLRDEQAKLMEQLHAKEKGSPEHRQLCGKIGPIAANLAVIELHLALQETFKGAPPDPGTAVLELKPLLSIAKAAARKLGARGSAEAMQRVIDAAPELKASPRTGVYAVDEDSIDAWVTSFDSGCIAAKNGGNQGAIASFTADAQYKMLRVCNGDAGATRSVARLFKVKMPGYEGHALWLDYPRRVGRGQSTTDEMSMLAYKHGIMKATAMGIPFLCNAGYDYSKKALAELGRPAEAIKSEEVTLAVDRGNVGLHHSQGIAGSDYWVQWPEFNTGYNRNATDPNLTYEFPTEIEVIMPPDKGA